MLLLFIGFSLSAKFPTLPSRYRFSGTLLLPYGKIRQAITVHHDNIGHRQFVDLYNGLEQHVHYAKKYTYELVVGNSTKGCLATKQDEQDALLEYIPSNPEGWKYIGQKVANGKTCDAWFKQFERRGERVSLTYFVDVATQLPVQYLKHQESDLTHHYTENILNIDSFGPSVDERLFAIPAKCEEHHDSGFLNPRPDLDLVPSEQDTRLFSKVGRNFGKPRRVLRNDDLPDLCEIITPDKDIVVPKEFSWRNVKGVIPRPKDQINCGSCWAQATSEAVAAQVALLSGNGTVTSAQQIMDCTWINTNKACHGGEVFDALSEMMRTKMPVSTEAEYPYLGVGGNCKSDIHKPVAHVTKCWHVNPLDRDALKRALFKYGPAAIYVMVHGSDFAGYTSGVFNDERCAPKAFEDLDHGVLLTGWKIIDGVETWEVMNSWSNMWGDNGFIYVQNEDISHDCGITRRAYIPQVELI